MATLATTYLAIARVSLTDNTHVTSTPHGIADVHCWLLKNIHAHWETIATQSVLHFQCFDGVAIEQVNLFFGAPLVTAPKGHTSWCTSRAA